MENPTAADDENSLLLGKSDLVKSINEDQEEPPVQPRGFGARYCNRFFLIEAFAWLNYLLGILNILFNAAIYMEIYEPSFFQKFETQCREQLPMVVFLDNLLNIATVVFFAFVLRYLKQVDLLEGNQFRKCEHLFPGLLYFVGGGQGLFLPSL